MAEHYDFGKEAELLACDFLKEKGYLILAQNYRYQKAEIDIIAEYQNTIIIIEVKARSTDAFILPQEAVNKKKIKLIVMAADHFVQKINTEQEVRFDIISILPDEKNQLQITHIESAFTAIDAN